MKPTKKQVSIDDCYAAFIYIKQFIEQKRDVPISFEVQLKLGMNMRNLEMHVKAFERSKSEIYLKHFKESDKEVPQPTLVAYEQEVRALGDKKVQVEIYPIKSTEFKEGNGDIVNLFAFGHAVFSL